MHYSLFVFVHYPLRHYSLRIMHYPLCIIHVVSRAHLHTKAPEAQHCAQPRSRGGIALQLPVPLLAPSFKKALIAACICATSRRLFGCALVGLRPVVLRRPCASSRMLLAFSTVEAAVPDVLDSVDG